MALLTRKMWELPALTGIRRWMLQLIAVISLIALCVLLNITEEPRQDVKSYSVDEYQKPLAVDPAEELQPSCEVSLTSEETEKKYTILLLHVNSWTKHVDLSCCKYNNCALTLNRSRFLKSDAVIFPVTHMKREPEDLHDYPFHERRPSDQVWVLLSYTSPLVSGKPDDKYKLLYRSNSFNWTMSYRLDSDIPFTYGILRTRSVPESKDYHEIVKRKTGLVAWLVSNCNKRKSRRIEYVKLLKHNVPVDVLGECGGIFEGTGKGRRFEGNLTETLNSYKFFLSFEDSNCKDYISEKVYKRWDLDVVLVMRGGAEYHKVLPNGTYINTDWFKSPKELGAYLKWLDSSPEEYLKFLRAKDRYQAINRNWTYVNAMCTLCKRLQDVNKYSHMYEDAESWIFKDTCYPETDIVED